MIVDPNVNGRPEPIRTFDFGSSSVDLLPSRPYSASYTPELPAIGFAFDTQVGVHSFGSDHRRDFRRQANSFAFVPSGCDVFSQSEQGGEYLKLSIAPELLSCIHCTQPINQVVTPKAVRTARNIRKGLMAGDSIEPLWIEQLIDDLWPQLVVSKKNKSFPLSSRQLKRVDEFIDANIDRSLSVIDMAQTINISAGHFSRLFKRSVGVSPFDYVIQRRLSYIRCHLWQSNDDLSAIALAGGFSSHAHMSMVFKKNLGVTPRQLREGK